MQAFQKFSSGYIKTILFAIEYMPRFQFPQKLFIIPHFIHHIQIIGLMLVNSENKMFDYIITLTQFSIVEVVMSEALKIIYLIVLFIFQILLLGYLLIATFETQRVSENIKLRLALEKRIDIVNSILHWYFTFYGAFTIPIAAIGFYFITNENIVFKVFSIIILCLQFFLGIILIYLLRNHRFAENNSFKRRFAITQMINYALSYVIVFLRYGYQSRTLQLLIGILYCIIQIIDQFYNCPYRDPFREPSLKVALILISTIIILLICEFNPSDGGTQLYWILFTAGLMSGLADSISGLFHEFAMTNYNSLHNLQEKYIIIGVDQFYFHFMHFLEDDKTKLLYYQQLIKHRENCKRAKCPSQSQNLFKVNSNDKNQLHRMTLQIVSCIFKTCHSRTVIKNGVIIKPKFEQLQLQYISFLSIIAQRPIIGFVELRKYQLNQNSDNSLYFRELTSKLGSELQFQILYLQDRMIQQQLKKDRFFQENEKLSISQIWRSVNFYQQITPTIIDLIDKKQKYWEQLINGYDDLGELQEQQEKLCIQIDQIYKQVRTQIYIPEILFDRSKDVAVQTILKILDPEDRNINILTLKIYSLLYSIILNDFDRAFQAEKQIEDLIREDRQKSIDIIDDSALQKDNAVIILVSLVKKKGHIVNLNLLTLANFFEYDNADDISSSSLISSFLPPDLRHHHDQKLNNFISKGYTKFSVKSIHSYYIQKFGYLRECYVKLSNLFQESDDFVITASVLKLFPSCDIIMFDSFGKIIGVSEEFYEKRIKSQMSISRFIEQGHIFLLIPFIMVNLRKMALANDLDSLEFIDYAYFYQDLTDLCLQYSTLYANQMRADYSKQQSTYQLSTIKSQMMTCNSVFTTSNSQEFLKMNGIPIPLLGIDRMIGISEFLIKYVRERGDRNTESMKVKYTIQFSDIESKDDIYPYFTLRMEQLSEFESDSMHTQTFAKAIKRTISTLKTGDTQMSATESMSGAYKTQQMTHDSLENQLQQMNDSIMQINKQTNDDSYIPVVGSKLDKVIFENPVVSEQGADDFEFQELFKQLQMEEEKQKEDLKDPEYESDQIEKKSSSTRGRLKVKKNILDIFTQNKLDQVENQIDQKASSRASTSRTSSSKSPYLLIRSLYQVRERDLTIWGIILLNVLIILVTLGLIFVKVFILQDQYNILQTNLIFVQYPETINNYFLRTTMYSQIFLQQQLGIANYSSQITDAILKDFNVIAVTIEKDLKSIYEDIITFESQVIPNDDYLNIINNLKEYKYKFDLTILLEQLSSTAISLNTEYTENILTLNPQTLSQIFFLRFNMVSMIKIARSYISYLNENLIYYEEQIINILTYIVVIELSILTIFIMFQIKILQDINDYMKKILILTTKLSEDEAIQINRNLQEIKFILKDPRQVLWKNSNFVNIFYQNKNDKRFDEMQAMSSMYSNINKDNKNAKQEVKKKFQTSTLTSRIYSLRLPQRKNYIFLLFLWLIIASYLLGALGLAISMISQIKPALALNLQLIEFKLKYDALVVFAETTITDRIEQYLLGQRFQISSLDFKNDEIINEFNVLIDGFQQQMGDIYDQLASSSSLLEAQKNDLLIPFMNNLCETLGNSMPSCTDSTIDPTDNNYIFISGGIVNAVHEFSKTLQTYWDSELNYQQNNLTQDELSQFLNTQTHKTQLTEHFIYQGKVLEIIAQKMLLYNRLTLDSVIQQFQIYIYIAGLSLIIVFGILLAIWVQKVEVAVYLSKMALTFIPSNALSEQKTLQELKNIQNY